MKRIILLLLVTMLAGVGPALARQTPPVTQAAADTIPEGERFRHQTERDHPVHPSGHDVPFVTNDTWMLELGGGYHLLGSVHFVPRVLFDMPFLEDAALQETRFIPGMPTAMLNLEFPYSRLTLRTMLSAESLVQEDGESSSGVWGGGFSDARAPHGIVREAMLSLNLLHDFPGFFSVSAGKGYPTFGTDDPMGRPAVAASAGHRLSGFPERWTVNAVFLRAGWNVEASLFSGAAPDGPTDFGNIEQFGDSWALRVGRRAGGTIGTLSPWEVTASYARVRDRQFGSLQRTHHVNAAFRHAQVYTEGARYFIIEASFAEPDETRSHFAYLTEVLVDYGRHRPYVRLEYASRPEFQRLAEIGSS
jgi:hypothetical protein